MIGGKRVVVVMPAYNASETLERTYRDLDMSIVDEVILVDDKSKDNTREVAKNLNIQTIVHTKNLGYGGNQKSCYNAALEKKADIVVMVHPDYQYAPSLVPAMACLISSGEYDCVLASRILGGTALKGGMPLYKYVANRLLTLAQNILMGQKLSEYHTGFRAFSKEVLERVPLGECNNDFVFDNEMLAQICYLNFRIGEISCPTRYFDEASSISFRRSVKYGFGVLSVSLKYFFSKLGIAKSHLFKENGARLRDNKPDSYVYHSPQQL